MSAVAKFDIRAVAMQITAMEQQKKTLSNETQNHSKGLMYCIKQFSTFLETEDYCSYIPYSMPQEHMNLHLSKTLLEADSISQVKQIDELNKKILGLQNQIVVQLPQYITDITGIPNVIVTIICEYFDLRKMSLIF